MNSKVLRWTLLSLAALALMALVFFVFMMERETSEWYILLGKEPPGKHTLAGGAFSVREDERGLCAAAVERSLPWQAVIDARRSSPETASPAFRFDLTLRRDETTREVSAALRIADGQGKQLFQAERSEYAREKVLKYRGIPLMRLAPGEGEYREAEALAVFTLLNQAAFKVMREPPAAGGPYAEALLTLLRREFERPGPTSPHGIVREEAEAQLADLAGSSAAARDQLVSTLRDENPRMRTLAATTLGRAGSKTANAIPALVEALRDADPMVSGAAANAIGEMSSAAVAAIPALATLLADAGTTASALHKIVGKKQELEPAVRAALQQAAPDLARALVHTDHSVRRAAAELLGCAGSGARSAAEDLGKILANDADSSVREAAAQALGWIGEPVSIAALATALRDPEALVAMVAAEALGKFGAQARDAAPALAAALHHPNLNAQVAAAGALGRCGSGYQGAEAALKDALAASQPRLRAQAATSLGELKTSGAAALLAGALNDRDRTVAEAAAAALVNLGPESAKAAVPAFLANLSHPNNAVRMQAVQALAALAEPPSEVVRALAEMLVERDDKLRSAASKALAGFGSRVAPALPEILAAFRAPHPEYRSAALPVLAAAGDAAAPELAALLRQQPEVLGALKDFLPKLGPKARTEIASALAESYRKADGQTKGRIVGFFSSLGADGIVAAPVLVEALAGEGSSEGGRIAQATQALTALGELAVPALAAGLRHDDLRARNRCAGILGAIGSKAKGAVGALSDALKEYKTAYPAAIALGKIGPAASPALPALLRCYGSIRIDDKKDVVGVIVALNPDQNVLLLALSDSDPGVRCAAIEVLAELRATDALHAIQALAKDPDAKVRHAAEKAVNKLKE